MDSGAAEYQNVTTDCKIYPPDSSRSKKFRLTESEKSVFIVTGVMYTLLVLVAMYGFYAIYRDKKLPASHYSMLVGFFLIVQTGVLIWFLVSLFTNKNSLLKHCRRVVRRLNDI